MVKRTSDVTTHKKKMKTPLTHQLNYVGFCHQVTYY